MSAPTATSPPLCNAAWPRAFSFPQRDYFTLLLLFWGQKSGREVQSQTWRAHDRHGATSCFDAQQYDQTATTLCNFADLQHWINSNNANHNRMIKKQNVFKTVSVSLWAAFESSWCCIAFVLSLLSLRNVNFHTLATLRRAGFQVSRFITKFSIKLSLLIKTTYYTNVLAIASLSLCICVCAHRSTPTNIAGKPAKKHFSFSTHFSSSPLCYFSDRNGNWIRKTKSSSGSVYF